MTDYALDTPRDHDVSALPPRTVGDAIADLRAAREEWRSRQDESRDVESFPSRTALERVVSLLAAALYPRRLGHFRGVAAEEDTFVVAKLLAALTDLEREIGHELGYWQREAGAFEADHAATIVRLFTATLGDIRRLIDSDVEADFSGADTQLSAHLYPKTIVLTQADNRAQHNDTVPRPAPARR